MFCIKTLEKPTTTKEYVNRNTKFDISVYILIASKDKVSTSIIDH